MFRGCCVDRARGARDTSVSADPVQNRFSAQGGELSVGHFVLDERRRVVHPVVGDRTAAVQAEHHDAVEFTAPQPMTAVQHQEESDNVL